MGRCKSNRTSQIPLVLHCFYVVCAIDHLTQQLEISGGCICIEILFGVTCCELLHGVLKGGSVKGRAFEKDSISRCGVLKSVHVLTDVWRNTMTVKENYCFWYSYRHQIAVIINTGDVGYYTRNASFWSAWCLREESLELMYLSSVLTNQHS